VKSIENLKKAYNKNFLLNSNCTIIHLIIKWMIPLNFVKRNYALKCCLFRSLKNRWFSEVCVNSVRPIENCKNNERLLTLLPHKKSFKIKSLLQLYFVMLYHRLYYRFFLGLGKKDAWSKFYFIFKDTCVFLCWAKL